LGIFETIFTALRDLSLHKFRSALATLGIIFAVASVMAMISISDGARREMLERIGKLGVDNVILRSEKPPRAERQRDDGQQRQFVSRYGLKRRDLEHVRTVLPMIRYAVGVKEARQKVYSSAVALQQLDLPVLATEPDYLAVTRSTVDRGRFINEYDLRTKEQVCAIGRQAARKVFGYADALNADIRIGSTWYRVVGIVKNEAGLREAGGDDIENAVFIPLDTAQMLYGDFSIKMDSGTFESNVIELDAIHVQVSEEAAVVPTAKRLENYLKQTHNPERRDFSLTVPLELIRQKAEAQQVFTVVMASIAGISLLIGGIGIMNIMLANVSDRRKEIGTRRALGARRVDILLQFVLEAGTLTTLGGIVGLAVGYGLSQAVASYAKWPVYISPTTIALSLGVSSVSGLVFGLWPAQIASRVNPIEALRSE
jgi:putative ABC transport system permease protein